MTTIFEAFTSRRFNPGEVDFSKTSLNDPHIEKIIDKIVSDTGLDKNEILKEVNEKLAQYKDFLQKSPVLFATIEQNAIEEVVFGLLQKHKSLTATAPKFRDSVFTKLLTIIYAEHNQFFPMRSIVDSKPLKKPVFVFVPSNEQAHQSKGYNSIDTAAAYPDGTFVFNRDFMQQLIDYAFLKGVKPKKKKYKCNGGEIPDEYCYIEFLILHEFMHYTYADFYFQKKMKAKSKLGNKIINYVGDFRSNYLLVKSGYEQLPMGLFNDGINYDRQDSYREMFNIVKEEFKKLNDQQKKDISKALDKQMDNHPNDGDNEGEDGEGGDSGFDDDFGDEDDDDENNGGSGDGDEDENGNGDGEDGKGGKDGEEGEEDDGKESDGDGNSKNSKSSDKPGKPSKQSGSGSNDSKVKDPDMDISDWLDQMDKKRDEIAEQIKNSRDIATVEEAQKDIQEKEKRQSIPGGGRGKSTATAETTKTPYAHIKPDFTWKSLLDKMISNQSNKTEESYHRPSRRGVTSAVLATQSGAAAIKPTEVPIDANDVKLAFVVDSSGSMQSMIGVIYATIEALFKKHVSGQRSVDMGFFLIKFSGSYRIYKCDFAGNKYSEISSLTEKSKNISSGSVKDLFGRTMNDVTNLTAGLRGEIEFLLKKEYNVVMISDRDILLDGGNLAEYKPLVKHSNFFTIFDSRGSFETCISVFGGQKPKTITYFSS
jgi:hypothetical protein